VYNRLADAAGEGRKEKPKPENEKAENHK